MELEACYADLLPFEKPRHRQTAGRSGDGAAPFGLVPRCSSFATYVGFADFAAFVGLRTKVRFGKTHPEKPDQKRKQYSQSCQGRFNNCGCTGGISQCN